MTSEQRDRTAVFQASCPTAEQLARWLEGACDQADSAYIQSHVARCQHCAQWLREAKANEEMAQDLRRTLPGESSASSPAHGSGSEPLPDSEDATSGRIVPPQVIEGYQLMEEVGRGGMGVVYKAVQLSTKRVVALKVLLAGPFADERSRQRFEREVELAASLNHPNIVTVYDSGLSHGRYYFAMDFIDGHPLDWFVREQDLSIAQTVSLFATVCGAVAFAHQRRVVHRDLKPSNILVDDSGVPHIVDFGLARLSSDRDGSANAKITASGTGQAVGTLAYMSPEQASGHPEGIDVRSDVYSLGVILYQLVTGAFPYEVLTSVATAVRNIQEADPTRPSKIRLDCGRDIDAMLLKALAKEPGDRYQSAAELRHDMDCWLNGLPIVARSASSAYLLRKLITRHRYTSTVVGLLSVIALGSGAVSCDFYLQARRALQQQARSDRAVIQATDQTQALAESSKPAVRRSAFGWLLLAWHQGRNEEARAIQAKMPTGSREHIAASFLLDPRPVGLKLDDFRRALAQEQPGFVEFVLAEHYFRDGNVEQAIKAYRQVARLYGGPDRDTPFADGPWLAGRARARLDALRGEKVDPASLATKRRQGR